MSVQKKIILAIGLFVALTTGLSTLLPGTQSDVFLTIEVVIFFILYLAWITIDEKTSGFQLSRMAKILISLVVGLPVFVYYLIRTRKGKIWKTLLKLLLYCAIDVAAASISIIAFIIAFHKY